MSFLVIKVKVIKVIKLFACSLESAFKKKRPVFVYVYNCLNDSVKALLIVWNSKASALYLCFTLRPAIFNSLRPVTVGSGRVEPTCETSVNHVFLKENNA